MNIQGVQIKTVLHPEIKYSEFVCDIFLSKGAAIFTLSCAGLQFITRPLGTANSPVSIMCVRQVRVGVEIRTFSLQSMVL